jgi:hypothetical protein
LGRKTQTLPGAESRVRETVVKEFDALEGKEDSCILWWSE